jgi:hypothetical protein
VCKPVFVSAIEVGSANPMFNSLKSIWRSGVTVGDLSASGGNLK